MFSLYFLHCIVKIKYFNNYKTFISYYGVIIGHEKTSLSKYFSYNFIIRKRNKQKYK